MNLINEKNIDVDFFEQKIRIGTKVSPGDYQLLKLIYGLNGWTIEARLAKLLLKDIQKNMNTKWFKAYVAKLQYTSMGQVVNIINGIRSGEIVIDEEGENE